MFYIVFIGIISATVTDYVNFLPNFSHLKSYHKNQVHGLANLNLQTKFEFTFRFLRIKPLRNRIQEQLYFNNTGSMKATFLAN